MSSNKCKVCLRPAFSNNYGVFSCDACKMFFRRIVVLGKAYKCKNAVNCQINTDPKNVKCKSCRYKMCLDAGMTFQPNLPILEYHNEKEVEMSTVIANLLYLDTKRKKSMKKFFTEEDFTLEEVLGNRRMKMVERQSDISNHDWSFLGIYTSIEFFISLDFMSCLGINDKRILLKNFCVKASLFGSAMRAKNEERDRLMTVDGKDVYPDSILRIPTFSSLFLNRIRCLLVNRLFELEITIEEFVLVNVIFFCNAALPHLSKTGQELITTQQKCYSSILLNYCQHVYQNFGPSRFAELISLCHVINSNFEDVQSMMTIFRFYQPATVYRKIVNEVI